MIPLYYFIIAVKNLLSSVIWFFLILLFVRALISWVNPDPHNPIVQFIHAATDPLVRRVRNKIPPLGMIDLSILVVILALYFIDQFVVGTLAHYANNMGDALQGLPTRR